MYSLDLRKVACRLYNKYNSLRIVATILEISHTTISRWLKNIQRKRYFRNPKLCNDLVIDTIKTTLTINPFISTRQLALKVKEICHVDVSKELVRIAISRLGYSKKKPKFISHSKNQEQKTKEFIELKNQYLKEGRNFFSLDETSFGRHGKDVKGYSLKGQPLLMTKKQPRITTVSSLVIISENDILKHQEVEGAYNKSLLIDFLLSLTIPSHSVILLDNVPFHHCQDVKTLAKKKQWILLYTPPYSPWYNPIEGVFSIIKRYFYKNQDIAEAFKEVSSKHCKAFFEKSFKI